MPINLNKSTKYNLLWFIAPGVIALIIASLFLSRYRHGNNATFSNTSVKGKDTLFLQLTKSGDTGVLSSAKLFLDSKYKGYSSLMVPDDYILEEYNGNRKIAIYNVSFRSPVFENKDTIQSPTPVKVATPSAWIQIAYHENSNFKLVNKKTGSSTILDQNVISAAVKNGIKGEKEVKVQIFGKDDSDVLGASDNDGYVDILIESSAYTDQAKFNSEADYVATAVLNTEPFKTFKSKIRITKLYTGQSLGCRRSNADNSGYLVCDETKVLSNAGTVPYNFLVVLQNPTSNTALGTGGTTHYSAYSVVIAYPTLNDPWKDSGRLTVHELGHLIAWLYDEYDVTYVGSPYSGPPLPPNCDTSSSCTLWTGISGTGCYLGCSNVNLYRSSPNSIMRALDVNYYNIVGVREMRKYLSTYSAITPVPTSTVTPTPAQVTTSGTVYCIDTTGAKKVLQGFPVQLISSSGSTSTIGETDSNGKWATILTTSQLQNSSIRAFGGAVYPNGAKPDQFSGQTNKITCTDSNIESIKLNSLSAPTTVIEQAQCKRTLAMNAFNFNFGNCVYPARATSTPMPSPYIQVNLRNPAGGAVTLPSPGYIANACWGGSYITAGAFTTDYQTHGPTSLFFTHRTNSAGLYTYCGTAIKLPNSNYKLLGVTPNPTPIVSGGNLSTTRETSLLPVHGWLNSTWTTGKRVLTYVVTTLTPTPTKPQAPTPTGITRTWNITLNPLCSSGAVSTASFYSEFYDSSTQLGYQNAGFAAGARTIKIINNSPTRTGIYVRLMAEDYTSRQMTGTAPTNMSYNVADSTGVLNALWYNDSLAPGNYTINFAANSSDCAITPTPTLSASQQLQKTKFGER